VSPPPVPALAGGDLLSAEAASARREAIRSTSRQTLARRHVGGTVARVLCFVALGIALIPLVALIVYTTSRGIKALSVDFFTKIPTPLGVPGGGISNAIVGSGVLVGTAAVMAVPVGIAVALFLVDRRGKLAAGVRFVADVMSGIPSIAIGIFAYALIVVPSGHYSAIAGSFALAVLMLPIVIRANEEALRTVPDDLWEAGLALGARQSRVVRSVVLRSSLPGVVTGNLLAVARAVGETAPLLFTALGSSLFSTSLFQPISSIPNFVYNNGTQPYPATQQTAWGAAFVLLAFVLVLSIVARSVAAYLTRNAR
jgi:phosphate transport system permease protein